MTPSPREFVPQIPSKPRPYGTKLGHSRTIWVMGEIAKARPICLVGLNLDGVCPLEHPDAEAYLFLSIGHRGSRRYIISNGEHYFDIYLIHSMNYLLKNTVVDPNNLHIRPKSRRRRLSTQYQELIKFLINQVLSETLEPEKSTE